MNECKIIAVANQKGGTGKTTTTYNLGAAPTAAGKMVLLVTMTHKTISPPLLAWRIPTIYR